mgnify:CR=1 FL=1
MDVLIVIAILAGVIFIGYAVFSYENFLRQQFNRTIFDLSKLFVLLVSEFVFFYALSVKDNIRMDNFIALIIVSLLIFIGCIFFNIRNYGVLHGFIVTLLQFTIAFLFLLLILAFSSSYKNSKKRKKKVRR